LIGSEQRRQFLESGYLVVPGVVPQSLCERVVGAILEFTGVDLENPDTWYQERFAGLGVIPLHHHQALWDLRQHPALYEVFTEIYEQDSLWVTMDRVGYKPPAGEATRHWRRAPVHWDCDPWAFDGLGVQGLVYLTDTGADQGAFACVPSIYRGLDAWLASHEREQVGRHPEVTEDELVPVAGPAGSLVLFHRLMPHTNGLNLSPRHRLVQYVTMHPAGDEEERLQRIELWRGKMPPEWAIRQKVPGQQLPEPGAAAELTPLGKKLVGLEAW